MNVLLAAAPPIRKPKPKPVPEVRPAAVSEYALPKWMPMAIGIVGIGAIVAILLTAKGRD